MEYLNPICDGVFLKVLPMGDRFCPTPPIFSWLANGRSLVFSSMIHPSCINEMRKNLLMSPFCCWDYQKLTVLTNISLFFGFFFSFKSFYCILFFYILRISKTPRLIRVKMFRLCNQEDNGAISKIQKKLNKWLYNVYKWLYLMWTKSSQSLFFISLSNQLFFRAPVNSCFHVLIFEWQRSELVHFLVKLQAESLQLITANKCLHRSFSRKLSKF